MLEILLFFFIVALVFIPNLGIWLRDKAKVLDDAVAKVRTPDSDKE